MLAVIGSLAVAGLVGAACGHGGGGTMAPAGVPGRAARGEAQPLAPAPLAPGGAAEAPQGKNVAGAGPGVSSVPELSPNVIKTASLDLSVKPGSFQDNFQAATLIAARHGGYVATSQTSEGRRRSGSLVLRVPEADFEAALGELGHLGRVRSESQTGEDVTGRVVDLQARLRNWQAQEAVLLRLMAKARLIDDSIVVQQHLQDVQLQIEEIRGELRAIQDQAAFSTISLSMSEVGFVPPRPEPTGLSFGRAWRLAVDGFVGVFAGVLVGLGYVVPVLVLMVVAVMLGLSVYRRLRGVPSAS